MENVLTYKLTQVRNIYQHIIEIGKIIDQQCLNLKKIGLKGLIYEALIDEFAFYYEKHTYHTMTNSGFTTFTNQHD